MSSSRRVSRASGTASGASASRSSRAPLYSFSVRCQAIFQRPRNPFSGANLRRRQERESASTLRAPHRTQARFASYYPRHPAPQRSGRVEGRSCSPSPPSAKYREPCRVHRTASTDCASSRAQRMRTAAAPIRLGRMARPRPMPAIRRAVAQAGRGGAGHGMRWPDASGRGGRQAMAQRGMGQGQPLAGAGRQGGVRIARGTRGGEVEEGSTPLSPCCFECVVRARGVGGVWFGRVKPPPLAG